MKMHIMCQWPMAMLVIALADSCLLVVWAILETSFSEEVASAL